MTIEEGHGQLRHPSVTALSRGDRTQSRRPLQSPRATVNRNDKVRRCITFVADVLFLVGIIWMLLLTSASLVGGSKTGRAAQTGPLTLALLLVLPAPALFFLDVLVRRTSSMHQAQEAASRTAARNPSSAAQAALNPSPPTRHGSLEPSFVMPQHWWEEERPPTYEEAIRTPKLELVEAPGLHHGAAAEVF